MLPPETLLQSWLKREARNLKTGGKAEEERKASPDLLKSNLPPVAKKHMKQYFIMDRGF